MKNIWAFVFGGLFSVGLMLYGMPNSILGQWDASLAFVMLGAIAVAFIPFQKAVHNHAPKTV